MMVYARHVYIIEFTHWT